MCDLWLTSFSSKNSFVGRPIPATPVFPPGPILEEYEAVVRAAGFEPGAVLPSSLAALAALETSEPALAACLSGTSLTTTITNGQDLLLYRTLDLPDEPAQRLAEVQRDIAVAAAYYEDKLATRARHLYYGGVGGAEDFARWIRLSDGELTVVDLAQRPTTGAATPRQTWAFEVTSTRAAPPSGR